MGIAGPAALNPEQLTKVGQFLNDNKLTFLEADYSSHVLNIVLSRPWLRRHIVNAAFAENPRVNLSQK